MLWAARHNGMPFGATSAVYGWHRVGCFLLAVAVQLFYVTGCRYVDDFFGVDAKDVQITGGMCLSFLCAVVGFPTDASKHGCSEYSLVVLGARVLLQSAVASVYACVDEEKRLTWIKTLDDIPATGICDPATAGKCAGRFSFACTVSGGKVGRAFVRPLYAQCNSPLRDCRISPILQ